MKLLAILSTLAIACSKDPPDVAPPIVLGKCVVDVYTRAEASRQTCVWSGYTWACNHHSCNRTGEAVGERPR